MRASPELGPTSDDVRLGLAVIVPCHNAAATLPEQLDALVRERWDRPWSVVVVDNRSTDDTLEIARRYSSRGVRTVSAHSGQSVAYARNAGVQAVDADAVAFCDGDDVIHPGWVRAIGDALRDADLVGGSNETVSLNAPWLASSRPMGAPGQLPRFGAVEFVPGCNCGIRTKAYEDLNGFDEKFVGLEDIEFSLRARASGAVIRAAPEATIGYRFRDTYGSVWRQGKYYGRGRPSLARTARELGLPAPSRAEGLRSWAWLVVHMPDLRHRAGRYGWVWVLANRVGVLLGAVRDRELYV